MLRPSAGLLGSSRAARRANVRAERLKSLWHAMRGVAALVALLFTVDCATLQASAGHVLAHGPSVQLLFAFESALLASSVASAAAVCGGSAAAAAIAAAAAAIDAPPLPPPPLKAVDPISRMRPTAAARDPAPTEEAPPPPPPPPPGAGAAVNDPVAPWACAACTYAHKSAAEMLFLSCAVCGNPQRGTH